MWTSQQSRSTGKGPTRRAGKGAGKGYQYEGAYGHGGSVPGGLATTTANHNRTWHAYGAHEEPSYGWPAHAQEETYGTWHAPPGGTFKGMSKGKGKGKSKGQGKGKGKRKSSTFVPEPPVDEPGRWVPYEDFQGKKSFGFFECPCGSRWTSAHSYKGFRQGCKKCERELFPKLMWQNDNVRVYDPVRDSMQDRGPHDSQRCEACRAGVCTFYMSYCGTYRNGAANSHRGAYSYF